MEHIFQVAKAKDFFRTGIFKKSNVVILDEPTSFLDREAMDKVMRRNKRIRSYLYCYKS